MSYVLVIISTIVNRVTSEQYEVKDGGSVISCFNRS